MSLELTWYGHSCFLIKNEKTSIIIDPFISNNPLTTIKVNQLNPEIVIVTHGHSDHIGDTIKIANQNNSLVISNFEICNWLQTKNVLNTRAIQIGGQGIFSWGKVKMTLALHSSSMPDGTYGGQASGVFLEIENKKIYHAGDTGLFKDMELLKDESIDIAILPIGDNFTMGIEDSVKAINMISPKNVIPMHFNTFEIISQNANVWGKCVKEQTKANPLILEIGKTYTV